MEVIFLNKKDFLMKNGAYNKNYEKVKNPKFIKDEFYDPMDIVQVKYEMLKEVSKNGESITAAAADFGFSRTAFYNIKGVFDKEGVCGLVSDKKGPKKPYKLTLEYQKQLDDYIKENPGVSSSELAKMINKGGAVTINKRTIERYRAKKKLSDR